MDHVVQQMAEVGLGDAGELLHRGRGEADLATDDGGSVDLAAGDVVPLDGVGVGQVEAGQQGRQRLDRCRTVLGPAQQCGSLFALSGRQAHSSLRTVMRRAAS
ncbi:hypothetical protein ACWGI9_04685 [Streptomyces sp. NPDC054833]